MAGAAVVARGAATGAAPRGAAAGALVPTDGSGAALGAPVGPPGGSVGNLMVGAAEGFGGKLIRTVSFLGWTLPVSFFGGTAPPGAPGMLGGMSAIIFPLKINRLRGLSNSYSKKKTDWRGLTDNLSG
jgi:hypothetical protein